VCGSFFWKRPAPIALARSTGKADALAGRVRRRPSRPPRHAGAVKPASLASDHRHADALVEDRALKLIRDGSTGRSFGAEDQGAR
jgi:hypothetical protein